MLGGVAVFYVIAVIASFLGFGEVAFTAGIIAKVLFFVFLALFLLVDMERLRGVVRSMLLRDANDPTHWRIETTWQSHEALAAMRSAGKPRGVQIFEAAGASPSLRVFDYVRDLAPPKGR